jgi:multicomponent Na+:H+ antiporter subunit E
VVLWIALWGAVTWANVLSGVLVAAVAMLVARSRRPTARGAFRPWRVLVFAVRFAIDLVWATMVVAIEIVTPTERIRTGIVEVPLVGCGDGLVTLVADAVSLTPGTLTLEVRREPPTLFVHVLHLRDVEEIRRQVRRLEVDAVRAFGSADAVRRLAPDDTRILEEP